MKTVYLFLENGMSFCGSAVGFCKEVVCELVFTTSMGGYIETLTDNCYYGQAVMDTFPLMGNYGFINEDTRGKKPALSAFIAREFCEEPSNFRCEGTLGDYLDKNEIVTVCGIDTREITKVLRTQGTMNCIITDRSELSEAQKEMLKSYRVKNAVESTGAKQVKSFSPARAKRKVVLWDFGESDALCDELLKRDCEITLVPFNYKAQDIKALSPDGVALSDGAGDPADNAEIISEIRAFTEAGIPVFGMGLGHQMLALARGGRTEKLLHGHRGASQPVLECETGRILITAQNRGYTVSEKPQASEVIYKNVNDKSIEGLRYTDIPACSLEFMPCSASGPVDTDYILDEFITLMCKKGN